MKQHIIVDGLYASWDRSMTLTHATAHVPYSYGFACPVCGDVWARAGVEHSGSKWHFMHMPCRKHKEGLRVPGSLWLAWDPEWNALLPHNLLLRELELHIAFWEAT